MLQIHAQNQSARHRIGRLVFPVWLGLVVLFLEIACGAAEGPLPAAVDGGTRTKAVLSADVVWAEFDNSNYQIFLSSYRDDAWTPKLQVTHNTNANIVPAVTRDHNGVLWIVWTQMTGTEKVLYYRTDDGKQLSDAVKIESGMKSNLAASIIEDRENQLWLIWAGFDGIDDDIYFSRWNGVDWSPPIMINSDDTTPDIQPVAGIGDDGLPWVRWSGFDKGTYKQFESRWNGVAWESEREVLQPDVAAKTPIATLTLPAEPGSVATALAQRPAEGVDQKAPSATPEVPILQLPEFIKAPEKASIFIHTSDGQNVSVPVRTLLSKKETS